MILLLACSSNDRTFGGTGGLSGSGGRQGTGGAATGGVATGGVTTSGGSTSTGGAPTQGGSMSTGGVTASGGASGSSGGGQAGSSGGGGLAWGGQAGSAGASAGGAGGAGGMDGKAGGGGNGGGAGAAAAGAAGMGTAGGSAGGGSSMQSSGCGKDPMIASNQYNNGTTISIMAAGKQRRYILNVPTDYDKNKPYRLIIAYHQLDGNDKQMYQNGYYHLLNLSKNSTIFVAPNGQKNGNPCSGTGNGESGCGWPNSNNSDIALADAVVAQVEENFCVDKTRIFATGWSYGASMSYKTACERPLGTENGFIRGIAIYSGAQLSGNCTPSKPVAFYGSHGTHDSVLNYDGGVGLAQNFAKANGCNWMTPTKVTGGAHMCTDLMGCMSGYPLEFCSFNGDHTPDPDNGQSGNSWQYEVVWKFLSQF